MLSERNLGIAEIERELGWRVLRKIRRRGKTRGGGIRRRVEAREREGAAKIVVVDVTVQTVDELTSGLEAPSAARIHPQVAELHRVIVVGALVGKGALAERVKHVDRGNTLNDRIIVIVVPAV